MSGAGANAARPPLRRDGIEWSVRWLAETGSTNADVVALAEAGEPEGIVVVADHQTAGRGRAGRAWEAPPGSSLLCTILLRPPAPSAALVTVALGVAAVDAVADTSGVTARLKWPNDLLVGEAKLAGILAEALWPPGSDIASGFRPPGNADRVAVAAGVGINVNWPDGVPDEVGQNATALNLESGRTITRADLLDALLRRLDHWYGRLVAGERAALLGAYRERSATIGRTVRLDLGVDEVEGRAADVDDDGRLLLEVPGGERRVFAAGDVVHLRRPD